MRSEGSLRTSGAKRRPSTIERCRSARLSLTVQAIPHTQEILTMRADCSHALRSTHEICKLDQDRAARAETVIQVLEGFAPLPPTVKTSILRKLPRYPPTRRARASGLHRRDRRAKQR